MINLKTIGLLVIFTIASFFVQAQNNTAFGEYVNKLFLGFPLDSNLQYKEAYMKKDTLYVKKRKTVNLDKILKYKPVNAYIYSMSESLTMLSIEYADIDKRTSFKEFTELTKKLKKMDPAGEFKKVEPEPGQTGPADLQYSFYRNKDDREPYVEVYLLEGYKTIYMYYYRKKIIQGRSH